MSGTVEDFFLEPEECTETAREEGRERSTDIAEAITSLEPLRLVIRKDGYGDCKELSLNGIDIRSAVAASSVEIKQGVIANLAIHVDELIIETDDPRFNIEHIHVNHGTGLARVGFKIDSYIRYSMWRIKRLFLKSKP